MSDFAARAAIARMNMQAVALAPAYAGIAADLQAVAAKTPQQLEQGFLDTRADLCSAYGFNAPVQEKPFAFSNGLAIIPISGSLINRFSYSYGGYATGYTFIRRQLAAALADADVQGIIFDVNSYGGEAAGCFELSAEIRASRKVKPSMAVVDSNAYSAGYALASAASKVVAIQSGGVGSVGVITMHVDQSKMLESWGVAITLIYEGEHKADGNSYEPLPEGVKASIAANIHSRYESFVALVAENMGIDAQVVRDTKSRCYMAEEALSLGLIHAVVSPQAAAQAFFDELSGSNHNLRQGESMSTATNEPGAAANATQASADEARTAERTRIAGIQTCDEAKGRESLANHLALNTGMGVDEAKAILAASPKAQEAAAAAPAAAAQPNQFEAAMAATKNPEVGADAANAAGGRSDDPAAAILADWAKATGNKVK